MTDTDTIQLEELITAYDNYQSLTHRTAIYPEAQPLALAYLALNINSELAEFGNSENRELAVAEIGDIYWHVSELANLANASLSVLRSTDPGLSESGGTWSAPQGDVYVVAVLAQELMSYHGYCAKHIRDGRDIIPATLLFLTRALLCLESVCDVMSVDIPTTLAANLDKLQSRQERGVLSGSGDNR